MSTMSACAFKRVRSARLARHANQSDVPTAAKVPAAANANGVLVRLRQLLDRLEKLLDHLDPLRASPTSRCVALLPITQAVRPSAILELSKAHQHTIGV